MSEGAASGENRVALAFEAALHSPLLYNNDIHKSGKILFNIYQTNDASQHLQLDEINEIRHFMDKFVDKNIEVIWGLAIDDNLKEGIRIAVLATGFGVDSIPMIDDDDEAGAQSIIDRIYDENSTSSKLLCLYELDDSDLDNAVLIDAIASRPAFSRTTQDINDFKTMRKSAAN